MDKSTILAIIICIVIVLIIIVAVIGDSDADMSQDYLDSLLSTQHIKRGYFVNDDLEDAIKEYKTQKSKPNPVAIPLDKCPLGAGNCVVYTNNKAPQFPSGVGTVSGNRFGGKKDGLTEFSASRDTDFLTVNTAWGINVERVLLIVTGKTARLIVIDVGALPYDIPFELNEGQNTYITKDGILTYRVKLTEEEKAVVLNVTAIPTTRLESDTAHLYYDCHENKCYGDYFNINVGKP